MVESFYKLFLLDYAFDFNITVHTNFGLYNYVYFYKHIYQLAVQAFGFSNQNSNNKGSVEI